MRSINKLLNSWRKFAFNLVPVNITILFFFVKKKEGTQCMCIDYIAKKNTIIDAYPTPCINKILDYLGGSVIFSKIN